MEALLQHIVFCSESILKQGHEQNNILQPWQRQHLAVFSNAKGALQAGRGVDGNIMTFLQEYNPNRPDLMEKVDVPGSAPPLRLAGDEKPKRRGSRAAPAPPKRNVVVSEGGVIKTAPGSPPTSRAVGRPSSVSVTRSGPPPPPPTAAADTAEDAAPVDYPKGPGSPLSQRAKLHGAAADTAPAVSTNPFATSSQSPPAPPLSSDKPQFASSNQGATLAPVASATPSALLPPGPKPTALMPPTTAGSSGRRSPAAPEPPTAASKPQLVAGAPLAAHQPDATTHTTTQQEMALRPPVLSSELPSLPGLGDMDDDGWALPPLADDTNNDDYLQNLSQKSRGSAKSLGLGPAPAKGQTQALSPPPPPPPLPAASHSGAAVHETRGSSSAVSFSLPTARAAFAQSPTLQRAVMQSQPVDVDDEAGQRTGLAATPRGSTVMDTGGSPSLDSVLTSVHSTLVQRVREETGISFEQARMSVLTVLSALWEPISTSEGAARAVAQAVAEPTEVLDRDAEELERMFEELTAMKDDTQQRNWAVEDDAEKICQALGHFRSILQVWLRERVMKIAGAGRNQSVSEDGRTVLPSPSSDPGLLSLYL